MSEQKTTQQPAVDPATKDEAASSTTAPQNPPRRGDTFKGVGVQKTKGVN